MSSGAFKKIFAYLPKSSLSLDYSPTPLTNVLSDLYVLDSGLDFLTLLNGRAPDLTDFDKHIFVCSSQTASIPGEDIISAVRNLRGGKRYYESGGYIYLSTAYSCKHNNHLYAHPNFDYVHSPFMPHLISEKIKL